MATSPLMMTTTVESPLVSIYSSLAVLQPSWNVMIGTPAGTGWIRGTELLSPAEEPFSALLNQIGRQARTRDRKTIAGGFALRYAWSSGMAIAPYLVHHCVPDISLGNVSFRFQENTLFERAALHQPRGVMVRGSGWLPNEHIECVPNRDALLARLRLDLYRQANAVVQALHDWSGFSVRGIWGLMTSPWAAVLVTALERLGTSDLTLELADLFFSGDDVIADMQPTLYPVIYNNVTRICQRQASCCRYYMLPSAKYCSTCPLISRGERLRRNHEWLERSMSRRR
jgi:hypothetical protein